MREEWTGARCNTGSFTVWTHTVCALLLTPTSGDGRSRAEESKFSPTPACTQQVATSPGTSFLGRLVQTQSKTPPGLTLFSHTSLC